MVTKQGRVVTYNKELTSIKLHALFITWSKYQIYTQPVYWANLAQKFKNVSLRLMCGNAEFVGGVRKYTFLGKLGCKIQN